jgi:pimeloyl-ACP methyl ester carboxylesterase
MSDMFEWAGRSIAWQAVGDGPAVVLCHGTPFSSEVWRPYAEALAADFTVYTWDMPGYGRSSKRPEDPVDFASQATAFAALLELWSLDRPRVIAHDFGGAVSLRTHLTLGVPFASLMLVNPVAIPLNGSPFFRFVQKHPTVLTELPGFIHEAVVRSYIRGGSYPGFTDRELDTLTAPWLNETGQTAFYHQIADFDEAYLEEIQRRCPGIDIPVQILWGEQDDWIPAEYGQRLAELIPGAGFELISGAGHLVQHDAPIVLANWIRRWLTDGQVSAAPGRRLGP